MNMNKLKMIKAWKLLPLALLFCNFSFGQLWYYANTDVKHIATMTEINGYLATQIVQNAFMEKELNKAVSKLKDELDINYSTTTGPYDHQSIFITPGGVLRTLNAISAGMLATTGTYNAYFPQSKRDYFTTISTDIFGLLPLQYMNPEVVRNADRQHVYRMRRDIMRVYSENERYGRSLILIMALFYAAETADETVINTLKALEIIQ